MSKSPQPAATASALIDARIAELADWRGAMLARLRALIKQADPAVTEEWKWATPVWSHHGLICTGEAYKKVVKMTFAKGALLADPSGLFNASLEGNTRRAIDFHEGDAPDVAALEALIRAAVDLNAATAHRPAPGRRPRRARLRRDGAARRPDRSRGAGRGCAATPGRAPPR